jgi:LAS superfamily LD-carboxypeptidase LdcB
LRGGSSKQPILYDKFGFPVGGIFPLVTEDGFVVKGFEPDLAPLVGFSSCSSRNSRRITLYLNREALTYFEMMQSDAQAEGVYLSICSAYRDYQYQKQIKRQYPNKAIEPGYSEHHLGTTVDLVSVSWNNRNFYWLTRNAHHYGYILTYYRRPELGVGEPNHWRYVGRETAEAYFDLFGHLY